MTLTGEDAGLPSSTARPRRRISGTTRARAQGLMRERQQLEAALASLRAASPASSTTTSRWSRSARRRATRASSPRPRPRSTKLRQEAHTREVEALLSGEADANDTYVEIHAGAGGTESQDWALMLERMYMRWAEGRDYKVEIIGEHRAKRRASSRRRPDQGRQRLWLAQDRVGRASAGAHLALRFECAPAHELCLGVGLSRRRRHHRRSTSTRRTCASTPIAPRGAGGQHVNTTDSAVRITPSADRHRRAHVRTSARSTRTGPPPGRCCARGSTRQS